ncbi:MAG: histidine--tRNA ligase [Alphaproteobacteria bacterium]|nr:histidine--tRNA ligase [Alphaproteobacteria bacterium]
MDKQKLKPISGFPEWLPEFRLIEQRWIDTIRQVFESYGYASIETRAVEPVDVLLKQGDTDKEIYAIGRLFEDRPDAKPEYALHYDMTVPLARFVAAHLNDLVFPVKRYQIQKAWRGERPQEGRFREFYQCDIDVIDRREIPLHFDAEMPAIMTEVLDRLQVGAVVTKVNNRKILEGFYRGLGIEQANEVIRIVDKLDKIGASGVARLLTDELAVPADRIAKILALAEIKGRDDSVIGRAKALGVSSPLLDQGLDELAFVLRELGTQVGRGYVADLSVARGLAYYTGTVYEAKFVDWPDYPTICGGGRYDNLVGSLINQRLPGIGISIGLTRIFAKLVKEGRLKPGRKAPTDVLVALVPGNDYATAKATARTLRERGIRTEQYHEERKLDQQLRYAAAKGIRYVWFPPATAGAPHEVKDLDSGKQGPADPRDWRPSL